MAATEVAYFLRSARLGFRTWAETDLPVAAALWGDPSVTQHIGGPFSREQIAERLTTEIKRQTEHGVQYWPMFLLASQALIGCCGLRPYRLAEGIYEIGVHIRSAYWGCGYAREASTAVIEHAFMNQGASALFAGHNPKNAGSRHLLHSLGFRYTHDEFYSPTGLQHPSYLLTRDEFSAARDRH